MELVPCILVVLCAYYGEMCDWLNVEIHVVEMCYWVYALCSCWRGYVLFEWRNELKWLNCLHTWEQIVNYDGDEIELRWWSSKVVMKCEVMNNGERPAVRFIFAYQIWMKLMKLKWVQPQMGGDSRNWNWYVAGTPAIEIDMRRGLPQEKEKNGRRLPQEKEKNGRGLPQKKKKCIWRGLPQMNDDMVRTPTRKGLGLQQCTGLRIW